jgi:hypothetical protein
MVTRTRLLLLGGLGALVLFALVGFAFVLFRGGDDEPASPTSTSTPVTSPTATIQPPPTPEPPGPTPITEITQISVPAGGTIEPGWGLVLGNALTGGAEVWLMPGGTMPQGISPSGRYFVAGDSLFDGWTGTRTKIHDKDYGLLLASFAPDDSRVFVLDAANDGRVLKLDGNEVARLPRADPLARATASQLDVVWSTDSRAVAITRLEGDHNRVDVVFDDKVQPEIPSGGMAGWSNKGHRLAVTGHNPAVYDFDNGTSFPLAIGGNYPSWSGGDEFVAVDIGTPEYKGVSAMDMLGHLGQELVRVYNLPVCFDIYWRGRFLQAGSQEVLIPSGDIAPAVAQPAPRRFPYMEWGDAATWRRPDGSAYATARITGTYALSFSWIRRDIDEGVPAVFLGLGGKDLCLTSETNLGAVHPPFTADQIPKPTPTPDK